MTQLQAIVTWRFTVSEQVINFEMNESEEKIVETEEYNNPNNENSLSGIVLLNNDHFTSFFSLHTSSYLINKGYYNNIYSATSHAYESNKKLISTMSDLPDYSYTIRMQQSFSILLLVYIYLLTGVFIMAETVSAQELPRLESPDFELQYGVVETDEGVFRRTIIRKPQGEGPFPAIVMLGGIGCYSLDSSEGVAYIDLLNELARAGHLTYWVEKSGMGDSQGAPCMEIDFDTELSGYRAGLAQIRTMPEVDQNRIIFLGHSMGGIIGPILASEAEVAGEHVHAVVAMATAGLPWFEYLVANTRRQLHLSDLSLTEIEEIMRDAVRAHYMYTIEKRSPQEILEIYPERVGSFQLPHHYTYFQQVADYSPLDLWSRAEVNALLIAGGADYVISIDEHKYVVDNLNNLRPGSAKFILFEDMDHGIRHARDQQAARAGEPGSFHKEVVPAIIDWLESIDG